MVHCVHNNIVVILLPTGIIGTGPVYSCTLWNCTGQGQICGLHLNASGCTVCSKYETFLNINFDQNHHLPITEDNIQELYVGDNCIEGKE